MNTNMNGKEIKQIWWPDTESEQGRNVLSDGERTLHLSASYHGDHDEFWIVECYQGNEVSRHNPRYVESIIWHDQSIQSAGKKRRRLIPR
jgi:hypothetical protein